MRRALLARLPLVAAHAVPGCGNNKPLLDGYNASSGVSWRVLCRVMRPRCCQGQRSVLRPRPPRLNARRIGPCLGEFRCAVPALPAPPLLRCISCWQTSVQAALLIYPLLQQLWPMPPPLHYTHIVQYCGNSIRHVTEATEAVFKQLVDACMHALSCVVPCRDNNTFLCDGCNASCGVSWHVLCRE